MKIFKHLSIKLKMKDGESRLNLKEERRACKMNNEDHAEEKERCVPIESMLDIDEVSGERL